jgi:pimeloyl-ACP methyl ester carboxylesterase
MLGKIVNFATSDGIYLPGFWIPTKKKSRKCIIFIHGLTGTFLWEDFLNAFSEMSTAAGYNFFNFNNRGSGIISGFEDKHEKWKIVGGALERFEDCTKDIAAAIDYAHGLGCREIVLIGHSTGCQKSVYYQAIKHDKRVKGVVLLAPASDVDADMNLWGKKKYYKKLKMAKRLVKNGKGKQLITNLSAARFWNLYKPNSIEGNIFNYRGGRMNLVSKVNVPILAVFGSKDKYSAHGPKQELAMLAAVARSPYTASIVKDAKHGFDFHEHEVAAVVGRWLRLFK